jgi:hypothetical protein
MMDDTFLKQFRALSLSPALQEYINDFSPDRSTVTFLFSFFKMASSLLSRPFKNWQKHTFRPAPAARIAKPIAAVVFPLPLPV